MRALVLSLAVICCSTNAFAAEDKLVIHEWGTFTSLQDETGRAIGGINVDDEPVPDFVRTLGSSLITNSPNESDRLQKGIVALHPAVTMRLETPVMYFYPPKGAKLPITLDVKVDFHGGWLTQFYPGALGEAPGFDHRTANGALTEQTTGRLTWKNLKVGTDADGPKTESKIWLAPRKVNAANVTSAGGESERYLFYRGVGHLDSPVHVRRVDGGRGAVSFGLPDASTAARIDSAWLVDIKPDGALAVRDLPKIATGPTVCMSAPGSDEFPMQFTASDYAVANLQKLRAAMTAALVADGLYADEAEAMLNTWEAAYFKSPGLRVFYIVPKPWTEAVLPLRVSANATITRVMIGRIELVTPEQWKLANIVVFGKPSEWNWMDAHVKLGRFKEALLLDLRSRKTPAPATLPVGLAAP